MAATDERDRKGAIRRLREGVLYSERHRADLFFVALEKSAEEYSPSTLYNDYAMSPTRFHWESQSGTHAGTKVGRRYVRPCVLPPPWCSYDERLPAARRDPACPRHPTPPPAPGGDMVPRSIRIHVASTAIALCAVPAQSQDWTTIDLGVTSDLHEFHYGGFSDRWLSGDDGFVAKSNDLLNWTPVSTGSSADLLSIVRWNSIGFLVGGGAGAVLRTSDAGATWVGAGIGDASQSYSLYSRSSGWANAVGTGGDIYQTRDAGDSWFSVYAGSVPLHDGSGFISSRSWAVGDGGLVLRTDDAGDTWYVQPTGYDDDLHCFLEGGGGYIFAAGENGTVLRSSDLGVTWTRQVTGTTETIRDIRHTAASAATMFAVGDNGLVLRTTNYGDEWCTIDAETNANLHAVVATYGHLFAIAGEGGLLKYTETGGGDCSAILSAPSSPGGSVAPDVVLSAPSPNPFRGSTSFTLYAGSDDLGAARVSIFDVTGRLVRELGSPVVEVTRVMTWDGRNTAGHRVAAGTYVIRVEHADHVATRSITVLP